MLEYATPEEVEEISGMSKKDYFEKKGYKWQDVEKILGEYKHYKRINALQVDVHHAVPTSNGGSNRKINKISLFKGEHRDLHAHHKNYTPDQQIQHDLDINSQVIIRRVHDDLSSIIDRAVRADRFYRQGVLI